jgi:hypothetical protein
MNYTLAQVSGFMRAIQRDSARERVADAMTQRAATQYKKEDFVKYIGRLEDGGT